jgi:hypothetical protein
MSVSVEGQAMKLEELIDRAGDRQALPSVARKVMEMVERQDVGEPRETLDLADHPALSFLDIPTEGASKLVTELQKSFAKEAAYWVH